MAEIIRMPKMSDTMTEGVIDSWLVKVGDEVKSGDILAEVATDKAVMELENYEDGTLLYIGVQEKEAVPVDGILAIIGEKDADYKKLLQAEKANNAAKQTTVPPTAEEKLPTTPTQDEQKLARPEPSNTNETKTPTRVSASPLAKKLAKEKGYDLSKIVGTGDNGRIIKRDIESYVPATAPMPPQPTVPIGAEYTRTVQVSQMRKIIAHRLSESKFTSPHFYLTMDINMDEAVEARKRMNEIAFVKISFNDIVIKAAATALKQHPKVNASWIEDTIHYHRHIHIGVAVAVEEGLLVPVVRFAHNKTLSEISTEVKILGKKAREKQLQPTDWSGNTFTISNLGMFGIEEFTAIINPPDACIMAVGAIRQIPIVLDGEIRVGNMMKVTLSCDHRIVDGVVGAGFLQTFKQLLEDPIRMLV